ncbi:hypothetical protein ZPAH1_orf00170 [Aeromonas phage ZPAH1]|nr:hypothetical protein ASwh1_120 [Aeromonas phage Aswh_1]QQG33932.1 hypothetical protein ZPAH1_orf00170 [Aeromonas phage ZPAH1]
MVIDQFNETVVHLVGSTEFYINPCTNSVTNGTQGQKAKMYCEELHFLLSDEEIDLVKESIIGTFSIIESLVSEQYEDQVSDIYVKGYHLEGATLIVHMTYLMDCTILI